MKNIRIEVALGRSNIIAEANPEKIDETVAWWSTELEKRSDPDHRGASKSFIIQALQSNWHHTDPTAAEMVIGAVVWLIATGPTAEIMLPFMRAGGMAVGIEVTKVSGSTFNFRTKTDAVSGRSMSL